MNNHISVLDGIRGLSILFVLFYHIGVIKSGFLGVDIFFILSGFLITMVIYNQIEENRFSFKSFYMRRVFRIFPMALIVLLLSFMISSQILFKNEFEEFLKYFHYAITFRSNILSMHELDYFDTGVNFKPLVHYWSLAVEIHFYLIIPIILYYFLKKGYIKQLIMLVLTIILFSVTYSIVYSNNSGNYFSTFSRIYEFLIGVIVYLFYRYYKNNYSINKVFFNLLNLVIMFLIFYIVFIDEVIPNILKSLSITLLVASLMLINTIFNQRFIILENRFLSYVGFISYSLYLIHYPILSFFRIIYGRELFISESLILLLVIFFLSILSYEYIEKRFIHSKNKIKYFILLGMIFMSISIIVYKDRLVNIIKVKDKSVEKYLQYKNDNHPDITNSRINALVNLDNIYKYESGNPKNIVVLWGDSHMNQISNHLANELNLKGYDVYEFSVAGCPPIVGVESKDKRRKCNDNSEKIIEYILNNNDIKKVVFFGYWKYYQDNNLVFINQINHSYKVNFFNKFEKTINNILSSNKEVVIILPTPVMNNNIPLFIARQYKLFGELSNPKELCISENNFISESFDFMKFTDTLSHKYSGVGIVNIHQYLLGSRGGMYCPMKNNKLLYRDDNHLTNSFGKKYSKLIVQQILQGENYDK